ncbi:MAG: hypothetical protein EAZ08_01250 [Cytophagales bacterium]|nr:MAG: hypothetical protein EAZ08_01250 [Cytophagales bacterium]
MQTEINTIENVKTYFKSLVDMDLSFHPDDDFKDYLVHSTQQPIFTITEAKIHNASMNRCFEVCEKHKVDIYEISLDVLNLKILS